MGDPGMVFLIIRSIHPRTNLAGRRNSSWSHEKSEGFL